MGKNLPFPHWLLEDLGKISNTVLVTNFHFVVPKVLGSSDIVNDSLTDETFLTSNC